MTEFFASITGIGTCSSVALIWLSTRANNERKKKDSTIQYTDAHDTNVEKLLATIYDTKVNGQVDLNIVLADKELLWTVEKYLFAMERLSVGINTNVDRKSVV